MGINGQLIGYMVKPEEQLSRQSPTRDPQFQLPSQGLTRNDLMNPTEVRQEAAKGHYSE